MKDGLENIDEVFKQAFDGFESNVDPSVWNNIQNSISSGSGGSSTPQIDPTAATGMVGKSLALKIVAGVALVGAVATSVYFIPTLFEDNETAITENIVADNNVIEIIEDEQLPVVVEENNVIVENNFQETNKIEENVVVAVESNNPAQQENTNTVIENTENIKPENNNNEKNSTIVTAVKQPTKNKAKKDLPKVVEKAKVEETEKISVKINVDVSKGVSPLTVQFDAVGDADLTYFWDFSDGEDNTTGDAPVHTYTKEGTYRVELKGLSERGETKSTFIHIIVEKDYASSLQKVPNVFTPNGDGENDFIKIRGKNIKGVSVKIANSQGKFVYFMDSMDDKWEGKDQNGNYLPQGQYYMVVVAVGTDEKRHSIKQSINLLQ